MHQELIRKVATIVDLTTDVSSAIESDDKVFDIIENQPATRIDALNRLYADKSGPIIEIRKKVIEALNNSAHLPYKKLPACFQSFPAYLVFPLLA